MIVHWNHPVVKHKEKCNEIMGIKGLMESGGNQTQYIIIPLKKFDANFKGATYHGYLTISTITAWTVLSLILYGVMLGQWLHEICVTLALHLRTKTQSAHTTLLGNFMDFQICHTI